MCEAKCEASLLKLCKKRFLSLLSAFVRSFCYEKLLYLQPDAREAIKNEFSLLLFLENCIISVISYHSRVTQVLYTLYVSPKEHIIIIIFSKR